MTVRTIAAKHETRSIPCREERVFLFADHD